MADTVYEYEMMSMQQAATATAEFRGWGTTMHVINRGTDLIYLSIPLLSLQNQDTPLWVSDRLTAKNKVNKDICADT